MAAVLSQWEDGFQKTLLVLPTGCGKTVVFAKITEECVKTGKRVLILAHRGELLDQAADKLYKVTGLGASVEKAEQSCLGSWFRVTVGSVQTLMRDKRLSGFPDDYFDTIIIDEAHHAISDSYQKILNYFCSADVLGVTATPDRGDMKNLGQIFDYLCSIVFGVYRREAYILDVYYTQSPMEITERETAERHRRFRVNQAKIESNNGGSGFARNVRRISEEFGNYGTVFSWFHQNKNKRARIISNSAWVQQHIFFPENWRDLFPEFFEALSKYQREGKNAHDDAPDALTGVAEIMYKLGG